MMFKKKNFCFVLLTMRINHSFFRERIGHMYFIVGANVALRYTSLQAKLTYPDCRDRLVD